MDGEGVCVRGRGVGVGINGLTLCSETGKVTDPPLSTKCNF